MDIINGVVNFVTNHWLDILAIIGAVDIILGIVVKWTKATWDDSVYVAIHNFIEKLITKKTPV